MMAPIVGFVLILCACMSTSGVYSLENCPDAKYPIEKNHVLLPCDTTYTCDLLIVSKEVKFTATFIFIAPEDISDAYYNFSMVGDNINAGLSGKAEVFPSYLKEEKVLPKNSRVGFKVPTKLEGNIADRADGVLTMKLYFDEQMKDTPDICVTTNIFLEDGEILVPY